MKQTALALSHLVETRFRQDALEIIGFDRTARRLTPVQLADVEPEWVQGTNLQHALMIAPRHLRRHPDAEPVVLVVTDGEPTAHIAADGTPDFHWPTTRETLRATVGQVDELSRYGAAINFFMLGDDPGLRAVRRRDGPPRRRPGVHPGPVPARRVRRRRLPPRPLRPPLTRRWRRTAPTRRSLAASRVPTRRESARRGGADPACLAAGVPTRRYAATQPGTSDRPSARRARWIPSNSTLDVARDPNRLGFRTATTSQREPSRRSSRRRGRAVAASHAVEGLAVVLTAEAELGHAEVER